MSATVLGIKVETEVSIDDPECLGIAVANLPSDEQARFFAGLAGGFCSFPPPGSMHMQVRFLTEDVKCLGTRDRERIVAFVRTLADHIAEVPR